MVAYSLGVLLVFCFVLACFIFKNAVMYQLPYCHELISYEHVHAPVCDRCKTMAPKPD